MEQRQYFGPWLIASGIGYAALAICGVTVVEGLPLPEPDATSAEVLAFAQEHGLALRLLALCFLAAAIPLAIWSASVYRCLRAFGATGPGSAIALAGGVIASGVVAVAGLITWVASRSGDSAPIATMLHEVRIVTGGPGFTVFFGLLAAGVSLSMLRLRVARPWAITGLVLTAVAMLSLVALLSLGELATRPVPITRLGGVVWLLAVSVLLPASLSRRAQPVEVSV
jgi:hypothetical protein